MKTGRVKIYLFRNEQNEKIKAHDVNNAHKQRKIEKNRHNKANHAVESDEIFS